MIAVRGKSGIRRQHAVETDEMQRSARTHHLRAILKEWVAHCNGWRGHGALGPGVPDPPVELELVPKAKSRHRLAAGAVVLAKSILGGLHHE
jgi:hypothetical protein